jgi:hypothetical protein
MPRWFLITIIEVAMILGCVIAAFTVPPSAPLRTFLLICVGTIVVCNILLFINLIEESSHVRVAIPKTRFDKARL